MPRVDESGPALCAPPFEVTSLCRAQPPTLRRKGQTVAKDRAVGYGLIGAGSFGRFCLKTYQDMAQVSPVAVTDVNRAAADAAAADAGIEAAGSAEALLQRDDVDIVHIATPPTTHRDLAMKALAAGKHVLVEKPLATTLEDGQAMMDLAQKKQRILSVNLMMRYDPLCEAVHALISDELLGKPLHGFFENYAKDEDLPPGHWFWDRGRSGGIFIEHGVHFFDLFEWWLGEGKVEAAQQVIRPGADFVEQVNATVRFQESVLVNFYHGFTQATRMDRQEMRILCERGTIRLFEWVPTAIEIDCLADKSTLDRIEKALPKAVVEEQAAYTGNERLVNSRHRMYQVDGRYLIRSDVGMEKLDLYAHMLRALLADQVEAIRSPGHRRRVDDHNGYRSLLQAAQADNLARA